MAENNHMQNIPQYYQKCKIHQKKNYCLESSVQEFNSITK